MTELESRSLALVCLLILLSKQANSQSCKVYPKHPGYNFLPDITSCGQRQIPNATKDAENPDHVAAVGEFPWMVHIKTFFVPEEDEVPEVKELDTDVDRKKPSPPIIPDLCDSADVDLAFNSYWDNALYIFKGIACWKVNIGSSSNSTDYEGPKRIDEIFPSLTDRPDAAFSNKNGIYFLAGSKMYLFEKTDGRSFHLQWTRTIECELKGIPNNLNAAMYGGPDIVYLFKDHTYYKYQGFEDHRLHFTRSDWLGVPNFIGSAVNLTDKGVYFFKHNYYFKFNETSHKVDHADPPYPRPVTELFKCEKPPRVEPPVRSLCIDPTYDLIFNSEDDGLYIFKGIYYWKAKDNKAEGPQYISDRWPGLSLPVDAAYTHRSFQNSVATSYFFKRSQRFIYKWNGYEFKRSEYDSGDLPSGYPTNIDGIMPWKLRAENYETTIIFKGPHYWIDNPIVDNIPQGPFSIKLKHQGLGSYLDGAVSFGGNRSYVLQGGNFYELNSTDRGGGFESKVVNTSPKSIAHDWFGCKSTAQESLCSDPKYDIIVDGPKGSVYVIKGPYYWRLDKGKYYEGPVPITNKWPRLPEKMDAAVRLDKGYEFYKGNQIWYYYNPKWFERYIDGGDIKHYELGKDYPKALSEKLGVFDSLDTVIFYNESTIYFVDSGIWKYEEGRQLNFHPISKAFPGLPEKLDSAAYSGRELYFFKNGIYYHWNKQAGKVDPPQGYSVATDWFGCEPMKPPTAQESLCADPRYDVIFNSRDGDAVYVFRGMFYWKVVKGKSVEGPERITRKWWGLPEKVDAVHKWDIGYTFYKGTQKWSYDGKDYGSNTSRTPADSRLVYWLKADYPKQIAHEQITEEPINGDFDAVLNYNRARPSLPIFFKGAGFWKWSESTRDFQFYLISTEFPGIPDDIDSVVNFGDTLNDFYFFKNGKYYQFNRTSLKVTPPEGASVAADWFKCGETPPEGFINGPLKKPHYEVDKSLETLNCSGVIISKNYVLAAASCFVHPSGKPSDRDFIRIYMPEEDQELTIDCTAKRCLKHRSMVSVRKLILHSDFDPRSLDRKNNLALLRLDVTLEFTKYVYPACLPTVCPMKNPQFGEEMDTFQELGWGLYLENSSSRQSQHSLQFSTAVIYPYESCHLNLRRVRLSTTQSCIKMKDRNHACDFWKTGNPVFYIRDYVQPHKYIIFGFPEKTPINCGLKIHGIHDVNSVFTRIPAYIKWILDSINAAEDGPPVDEEGEVIITTPADPTEEVKGTVTPTPTPTVPDKGKVRPANPTYRPCNDPVSRILLPMTECGKSIKSIQTIHDIDLEVTSMGEYPWTCYVTTTMEIPTVGQKQITCNAVLISKRYVLTAAHCVTLSPPLPHKESSKRMLVVFGDYDLERDIDCLPTFWNNDTICNKKQHIDVDRYFVHGKFDPFTRHNDIALLRMKVDVQFNDWVQPVCLPTSCWAQDIIRNNTGKYLTIRPLNLFNNLTQTGWYLYKPGVYLYTDFMQRVRADRVEIQNLAQSVWLHCNEYLWLDNLTQYCVITLLSKPKDYPSDSDLWPPTCDPYTGGPLLAKIEDRFTLMGISSISEDCRYSHEDKRRDATVYTKLTAYLNWIIERMFLDTYGLQDFGDEFDEEQESYDL